MYFSTCSAMLICEIGFEILICSIEISLVKRWGIMLIDNLLYYMIFTFSIRNLRRLMKNLLRCELVKNGIQKRLFV